MSGPSQVVQSLGDQAETFLESVPMMNTTTAEDIFNSVVGALDRVGVDKSRAVRLAHHQ